MVCSLAQPQLPPLEITRSRAVSAIDSRIAPSTSNRPGSSPPTRTRRAVRRHLWRLRRQRIPRRPTASRTGRRGCPPTAGRERRQCQASRSSRQSPIRPFLGSSSRMMLMPTGIRAGEALQGAPDNQRDEASGAEGGNQRAGRHQVTMHTSIISRFPYMSASLATIGWRPRPSAALPSPTRRCRRLRPAADAWNPGSSGITMVCCNDTVVPAKDSTVITAHVGTGLGAAAAMASAVIKPPSAPANLITICAPSRSRQSPCRRRSRCRCRSGRHRPGRVDQWRFPGRRRRSLAPVGPISH